MMADQERRNEEYDLRYSERVGEADADYSEEVAAEIAAPGVYGRSLDREEKNETAAVHADYSEETSAEIAAPGVYGRSLDQEVENEAAVHADYSEETSAEIAAPGVYNRSVDRDGENETAAAGRGVGYAALALSILSLFVLPVLFGATGIVLGFIARRRGSESLGGWAIAIGAISIIVGMFILPFF
ncbi:DUF4190 domain-containing protein [Bacillus sp. NTK034]|nr:DUF4190 domain-containing protein [Bacillus sp. NTK034]